jgi:hypothetical protein
MFLGLPALHMVILPLSNIGLRHLPPPVCCFMLLFTNICCTDFYLFVLCSSLLIYFLSHFVPALNSSIGSWFISALHVVFLPCNSTGLRLSHFYFFIIHLLIKYCTLLFFFSPTLLMCMFFCVLLSHQLEFILSWSISLQSCPDYHTPLPPNHLHQPYWLTPHC